MEINMQGMKEQSRTLREGGVVVAPRLKKTVEMINSNGDVIDPVTKQVIKSNKEEKE